MGNFEEDMEQYESEWEENLGHESQAQVLPQGTYQAKIAESRVGQTGWDDTWEFFLRFEDLQGAGQVSVWDSLETEIGRQIAASHAKALGYSDKLSGLRKACEEEAFDDLVCEIRVKDNVKEEKTYKSVYINRLFGKLEEGVVSADASTGGDDSDLPF